MDTSAQGMKRRRYRTEEKERIVIETLEPGASVSRVAQRYALNANVVFRWRREYREGRFKNGAGVTHLLPVNVSDEQIVETANVGRVIPPTPWGTMEIQLPKGKVQITGRVDLMTLRAAMESLMR